MRLPERAAALLSIFYNLDLETRVFAEDQLINDDVQYIKSPDCAGCSSSGRTQTPVVLV